jgi:hypothetical protein
VTTANNYTNVEMTDMHFIYGLAGGNMREAHHLYQEQFPGNMIPKMSTFSRIHQHLGHSGASVLNLMG